MTTAYLAALAAAVLAAAASAALSAEPAETHSEDGYVLTTVQSNGDREWKLGTAAVEKTIVLRGGEFALKSFVNKRAAPPKECIQGGSSREFRVTLDKAAWSGRTGGFSCEGSTVTKLALGELRLDVTLIRKPIRITKHYIVYPGTGIIREWLTYRNAGSQPVRIANPSFAEATVMSEDIKQGLSIVYFSGGAAAAGSQRLSVEAVDQSYSRTLTSCGSAAHLPLMVLFDKAGKHGVTMGWDYLGPWASEAGTVKGETFHLGIRLDDFSRVLKPGDSLDTPMAFHGVFAGDLDDMGNLNLDWQYRYFWQHKNASFFARPRYSTEFDGPWWIRCGTEELWARRLAMDLYFVELARYVGAGILWNDAAWYDQFGDWNGPDWSQTHEYVKKHGMEMLVWLWSSVAYPGSRAERDLGGILTTLRIGPPYIDQSRPEATDWQLKLLAEKAKLWGGFQWRYDFATALGTDRLAADQEFRRLNREFVAAHPDCAIDACMGGGNGIGYDISSYAQSQQLSDGGTADYSGYYTSMIVPPDMLYDCFTIMGSQGRKAYDIRSDRIHLRMLPVWISDPGSKEPYQSGTRNGESHYRPGVSAIRPESIPHLESVRHDWDLHRYFLSQEVIGRWSHVFRPEITGDEAVLYFQRMDREGKKGYIVTNRSVEKPEAMPAGSVTVFPKGLVPELDYDVRFDLSPEVESRAGADLMARGIVISSLKPGEIIYLNLPDHPGSGTDKQPPTPPTRVTQRVGTHVFTQGVEVAWEPASDNRWLSCYELFRVAPDGSETNLGRVSQGTFFFDRSALASELMKCRYSVRAVDGDGNVSAKVEAVTALGEPETHYGFGGYGPEQGYRGWSYELAETGSNYRTLYWMPAKGYEGLWADEVESCSIGRTLMHPHPSGEIARVFTIPREGAVTLRGAVRKDPTIGVIPSDKCAVRILKNDTQVWPIGTSRRTESGWQKVPTQGTGVAYEVRTEVKPGDRILHVLRHNPDNVSGDIAWDAVVRY